MEESLYSAQVLIKFKEALKCRLCNNVTENPHTVGRCGHFACYNCLLSMKISQCPVCRQQFYTSDLIPDVVVKTVLNEWNAINDLISDSTETIEHKVENVNNKNKMQKSFKNFNEIKKQASGKKAEIISNKNMSAFVSIDKSQFNNKNSTVVRNKDGKVRYSNKINLVKQSEEKDNENNNNSNVNIKADSETGRINHEQNDELVKNKIALKEKKDVKNDREEDLEKENVVDIKKDKSNDKAVFTNIAKDNKKVSLFSSDFCVTPPTKTYLSKKNKQNIPLNMSTDSDDEFKGFDLKTKNIQPVPVPILNDNQRKLIPLTELPENPTTKKLKVSVNKKAKITNCPTNKPNRTKIPITENIKNFKNESVSSSCEIISATPLEVTCSFNSNKNTKKRKSSIEYLSISSSGEIKSTPMKNNSKKKDIMKRNKKGETPLQVACEKGNLDLVKSLLDEGANPNTKDYAGWTPLHEAVQRGNIALVETLLNSGAYINTPGYYNITPLLEAVLKDNIVIARLLLQHGADVTLRSRYNYLPMNCTQSDDMKKLLEIYRAKLNFSKVKNFAEKCEMLEPTVIHGVNLDDEQTQLLQKFCNTFNLVYSDSFRSSISHIVVNDRGTLICSPDISVLRAIINGTAIISYKWVERCFNENNLLKPDEWEIKGTDEFPNSNAPFKSRYCANKLLPKLFDGLNVYVSSYWPKSEKFTKTIISELVKESSAVLLNREPDAESIPPDEMTVMFHADVTGSMGICSHIILYVTGYNEPQLKYNMKHIKTLPLKWFLECIQTFSIVNPP
ncbi:uncharacterized protein LOC142328429 [Lycorma delicatula]|uniref:uncharacterized protein LOC142328429 n=1 Tax=Lycorma delicatula TaxID=130591 RepID=UPI003F51362B